MKTVKAKIKGTNAILEGCVCDDSFFVSVDHDIFERYALCEVEICKDSLQVPETCKENMDSFTSLEEAAEEYRRESLKKSVIPQIDGPVSEYIGSIKAAYIAGAKWQANQFLKGSPLPEDTVLFQKGIEEGKRLMMEEAVEGEIGYWNQRGLSIRLDKSLERLGYDMDTKVKIVIVKQDDRPRD